VLFKEKESEVQARERERITDLLQEIAQWRASGLKLAEYAEQNGQTLSSWRGKVSWEARWHKMLQGQRITRKVQAQKQAPVHTFVKAMQAQQSATVNQAGSHLRITLVGAASAGLKAQIDWPLSELQHSSQWLREVLA
jgi:hypothetical protein